MARSHWQCSIQDWQRGGHFWPLLFRFGGHLVKAGDKFKKKIEVTLCNSSCFIIWVIPDKFIWGAISEWLMFKQLGSFTNKDIFFFHVYKLTWGLVHWNIVQDICKHGKGIVSLIKWWCCGPVTISCVGYHWLNIHHVTIMDVIGHWSFIGDKLLPQRSWMTTQSNPVLFHQHLT